MLQIKKHECVSLTIYYHLYILGISKFRVNNTTLCFYMLLTFFVVFHQRICVFIIFISFCIKFPQQNINQSETWISVKKIVSGTERYSCLNKVIHQIDRKWTVAFFSNFNAKIWVGFCPNKKALCLKDFILKPTQKG